MLGNLLYEGFALVASPPQKISKLLHLEAPAVPQRVIFVNVFDNVIPGTLLHESAFANA